MKKLLLTVTLVDPEYLTFKDKPVIYTNTLVEFHNLRNRMQVYKIYEMDKLEKVHTLIAKNFCNFSTH